MAQISYLDKRFLEKIFMRSGYVLDFTNNSFADFFNSEVGVDIYSPLYEKQGTSKANRLRAFLEIADAGTVAVALMALRSMWTRSVPNEERDFSDDERLVALIEKLESWPDTEKHVVHGFEEVDVAPTLPTPAAVPKHPGAPELSALASYAHQSEAYNSKVLGVVQRLRGDGIDCWIDAFETFPKEGWPLWMQRQVSTRRWIVIFASAAYKRRADGNEDSGRGLGAIWEHGLIRQELYEASMLNERFIPVGFGAAERAYVPTALKAFTYFDLDSGLDYQRLLSVLRSTVLVKPRPLGSDVRVGELGQPSPEEMEERYSRELKSDNAFFPIQAPALNGRLQLIVRPVTYKMDRLSRNVLGSALERIRVGPRVRSQFSDDVPYQDNTSSSGFGSGAGMQSSLQNPLEHKVEHVRIHRSGVFRFERLLDEDFGDDHMLKFDQLELRLEDLIRNITLLFAVAGRVAQVDALEADDRLELIARVSGLLNRTLVASFRHPDARTMEILLNARPGSEHASTVRLVLARRDIEVNGVAQAGEFIRDLLWNFGLVQDGLSDFIAHVQLELYGRC